MESLKDIFEYQLQELYSIETQLIDTLSIMANWADSTTLKKVLKDHLKETKVQKSRIENICEELKLSPFGERCIIIEEMTKGIKTFISQAENNEIMDIGLIAQTQHIEHYEISGYGTEVRYAKELGYRNIAIQLQKSLHEEYDADNAMLKLAENRLDKKAIKEI